MLKVVEVFEVMQLSLVTLQHRKAKQARKQIKVTEERRDIEKEKNGGTELFYCFVCRQKESNSCQSERSKAIEYTNHQTTDSHNSVVVYLFLHSPV